MSQEPLLDPDGYVLALPLREWRGVGQGPPGETWVAVPLDRDYLATLRATFSPLDDPAPREGGLEAREIRFRDREAVILPDIGELTGHIPPEESFLEGLEHFEDYKRSNEELRGREAFIERRILGQDGTEWERAIANRSHPELVVRDSGLFWERRTEGRWGKEERTATPIWDPWGIDQVRALITPPNEAREIRTEMTRFNPALTEEIFSPHRRRITAEGLAGVPMPVPTRKELETLLGSEDPGIRRQAIDHTPQVKSRGPSR